MVSFLCLNLLKTFFVIMCERAATRENYTLIKNCFKTVIISLILFNITRITALIPKFNHAATYFVYIFY